MGLWTGSVKRFSEPLHKYIPPPVKPGTLDGVPSRPGRRTTIRELADYTGLSPAAVSYALRGMQVSAETERRVREAAEELGYEADPIARALAGGSTGVVGLLVGSLSDFWIQELVRAVQRELYEAARSTLVADADGEPGRELELARRLVDQRVDGLVVVPIGPASGGWASIAREVATVTIGDALPGVSAAGEVIFDNERGVRDSLEHLSALGHRRITVLSWAVETLARPRGRARGRDLGGGARPRLQRRRLRVLAQRLAPAGARAAARRRAPDGGAVPVRLDRLRRLRRVRRARVVDTRRRRRGGLRRPPDLAPARAAADLDGVGRRPRGGARHRLPARPRSTPTARRPRCARSSRRCSRRARRPKRGPADRPPLQAHPVTRACSPSGTAWPPSPRPVCRWRPPCSSR